MNSKILFLGIILIKGIQALTTENITQFIGEYAFLPCTASDNILPSEPSIVEWLNITDATADENVIISDSQSMLMGRHFIQIHNENRLRVEHVVLSDSGTYGCKVYGNVEENNVTMSLSNISYVNLIVEDPDPPGKPQEVSELVKPTQIQVMWAPGNGGDVLKEFVVEIRRADEAFWTEVDNQPQGPSAIMAISTGLEPYTDYLVRVTAQFNGYTKVSQVSNLIKTKPGKPLSAPEVIEAHAIDATSGNMSWIPPDDDIRGVITGFRVLFIYLEDGEKVPDIQDVLHNETNTVLKDLKPATLYNISVAVKNNADEMNAFGPYSNALSIRTFESIPGQPEMVIALTKETTTFLCVIMQKTPNGDVFEYELYYRKLGVGNWTTFVSPSMVVNVKNLEPFTQYEITSAARNSIGLGERGEITVERTDTGAASQPRNVGVEFTRDYFIISWERPEVFYENYTSYKVKLDQTDPPSNGVLMSEVFQEYYRGEINKDMSTVISFTVTIIPTTESAESPSLHYNGRASTPLPFTVEKPVATPDPDPTMVTTPTITGELDDSSNDNNVGLAVGLVFVFLFIIVVVVILGIYYMHRIRRNDPSDPHKPGNGPRITSVFDEPEDPEEPPIPIEKFEEHVVRNHANSDSGFAEEFEEIQICVKNDYAATSSADPACKSKNRYTNIIAYDHSRVKLQMIVDKPCSDYINGNYIDGYNKKNAFIATQGPLKTTVEDFWRMIWEQNSYTIIMITNLMEKGRRKCDKYWPIEGSAERYGEFEVTCDMEDEMASFAVRNFVLKNTKKKKVPTATLC